VSDGPFELAEGASVVPTPNPMSIFWACAKFENAEKAKQAKVRTMAIRDIRFKQTSMVFSLIGLDAV
jgi:hypothetical protein